MGAYRAQAAGVSSIAWYFMVIGIATGALPVDAQSSPGPILVNALVDVGFLALLVYWVHTTISVSRRSDPFERDTLRYSSTKYVWILAIAIPIAISLVYNPIGLVFTTATPLSPLYFALALAPWVIFCSFGAILLFLGASGSKDRTLQSHVKWLALFVTVYLMIFVVGGWWSSSGGNAGPYIAVIFPLFVGGQTLAAYSLYRSVKSLAPTTKAL